jgi:hypothetical protein
VESAKLPAPTVAGKQPARSTPTKLGLQTWFHIFLADKTSCLPTHNDCQCEEINVCICKAGTEAQLEKSKSAKKTKENQWFYGLFQQ